MERRMSKTIEGNNEAAKEALSNVLREGIAGWIRSNGFPQIHPDVLIEPLVNIIATTIVAHECPGCQIALAAKCAAAFGNLIVGISSDADAPEAHHGATH